jgi:hypothetical protein
MSAIGLPNIKAIPDVEEQNSIMRKSSRYSRDTRSSGCSSQGPRKSFTPVDDV